jgi:hypothetical protein
MSDQGLRRGQFEPEIIAQEPPNRLLDLLGLPAGAGEAEQPIVGLCRAPGYAAWCGLLLVRPVSGVVNAA